MSTNSSKYTSRQGTGRDRKGRPQYLARLPLWKRYPRLIIVGSASFFAFLPFSAQFYQFFFTKPEDIKDKEDWWPSEIARGRRNVDILHDYLVEKKKKEAELALQKAANSGK